ncbi:hypothetical protein PHISP_07821 [Aspergillus sp. HF37]|nr:hypothetical protein PHISP_07821 [Aspergillus sp. HF37]
MTSGIPTDLDSWVDSARDAGVHQFSPCDLPANGDSFPSASKMQMGVYLTFRSYWKDNYANALTLGVLGLSVGDLEAAKKHLHRRRDYERYLDDVGEDHTQKRPLGELPDLGAFTLVRHFQQQITLDDILASSPKHAISPIITRSQTAAATAANPSSSEERTNRRLDFQGGGGTGARSPAGSSSRSSSSGYPCDEYSPLALRGKASNAERTSRESSHARYTHAAFGKSGQHSPTSSSLSALSPVSSTAANILYAPTADEAIVNTFLVLLLNALGLEARTDGCLRMKDNGSVVAIVEVKPHMRSKKVVPIKMQETTQMVTWIAQEGFPDPSTRRFVLLSQDRHEVYLTVPLYDADYIKHLKGEADAETPMSFLKVTSYGPWDIYNRKSLDNLCCYLLALTMSASSRGP